MPNSAYQTAVLALSPFCYYPMDDTAASLFFRDISGNANNCTLPGNTLNLPQVAGLIATSSDTAANMTAGAITMKVATPLINLGTAGITVMCWINTTNVASLQHLMLANKSPNGVDQVFQLRNNSGSLQWLVFDSGGTVHQINWPSSVSDGKNHFIVGTWDLTTQLLYVDGVASTGLANSSTPHSGTVNLGLGNPINLISGNAFVGVLDECAVFLSALTSAQITHLFNVATTT